MRFSIATSTVAVSTIAARDYDWRLEGQGKLFRYNQYGGSGSHCVSCPYCAHMYDAVVYAIPTECQAYRCTTCDESESLEYRVTKIDANGLDFPFEGTIICARCRKKVCSDPS